MVYIFPDPESPTLYVQPLGHTNYICILIIIIYSHYYSHPAKYVRFKMFICGGCQKKTFSSEKTPFSTDRFRSDLDTLVTAVVVILILRRKLVFFQVVAHPNPMFFSLWGIKMRSGKTPTVEVGHASQLWVIIVPVSRFNYALCHEGLSLTRFGHLVGNCGRKSRLYTILLSPILKLALFNENTPATEMSHASRIFTSLLLPNGMCRL